MKTILVILKIWGFLSLLFIGWFIAAHLLSEEPMVFNNRKELIAFVFFPLGILFGLMLSFRWELTGGLICVTSIVFSSLIIPELLTNRFFILIVLPGAGIFLFGWIRWKFKLNS